MASGGAAAVAILAACGGRTGLFVDLEQPVTGTLVDDAAATADVVVADAGVVVAPPDASVLDAIPPLDVVAPPIEASPPAECADASATLIYVVTSGANLYSFDPDQTSFTPIGALDCKPRGTCSDGPVTPFSMAVDHTGQAYIVYCSGELFHVSVSPTDRAKGCQSLPFASGQNGFSSTFGMGFSADAPDGGETLYVAGDVLPDAAVPPELAHISLPGLVLSDDGPLINLLGQPLYLAELTGTGTGDLFAFHSTVAGNGSAIAHVDKASGLAFEESALPGLVLGGGWAFAIWGGDFYTFTGIGPNTSEVSRFRPSDQSLTSIAYLNDLIVGAGVSTCAPQR
jgi:hypothetical protein